MKITIDEKPIEMGKSIPLLEAIYRSGSKLQKVDNDRINAWIANPHCPAIHLAEVNGRLVCRNVLASVQIRDGMQIKTSSPAIEQTLDERIRMLQDRHECYLIREMQDVVVSEAESAGHITMDERDAFRFEFRRVSPSLLHDPNLCVRCKACIETCRNGQTVEALRFDEREGVLLDETRCVRCGQCIHACLVGATAKYRVLVDMLGCQACPFDKPLGAMREQDDTESAWSILHTEGYYPVAQFAPAVRASLAEEFGLGVGDVVTAKLYAALRRLGFKQVWDTNFSADLTIMEEGSELLHRLANAGKTPMMTSCCPGWVRFAENFFPDLLPHLSTAKSPQQMMGAVAKAFAAPRLGIDPSAFKVISFMPCTAKKTECAREEMKDAALFLQKKGEKNIPDTMPDVDLVLTTRELARLLKMAGVDLAAMPEEKADSLLGAYTGAAPIFGRTGGVMEAALRTATVLVTGSAPKTLEFSELETRNGIKTATLRLGETSLKVAVAHGLKNARKVCESIQSGGEFASYHFIEIMACPGGCVGGGGQPIPTNDWSKQARHTGLNQDDRKTCTFRMSHENPEIQSLYSEFLQKPLSPISHELLHTHYTPREK